MSSKNSISRIVITLACAFVALFEVLNLLDVFKHIKYYPFLDLIVAIVIPLALIGFCALAILKGDNKDTLVALALTAYAGINSAWIFIKACEALANGWFSIDYILNISFYLVLLFFAIKDIIPIPGKENLSTPIVQYSAIAFIVLLPIFQMFILPLFTAQGGIAGRVGGQILITLLEWLLQSIAFTWFIKE